MSSRLLLLSAVVSLALASCVSEEPPAPEPTGTEPELLASDSGGGRPMWVGTVERRHLTTSPFDEWYESGYAGYEPSSETVEALSSSLDDVEVEVYFGTWCGDSRRDVPRLNRVLDDAGFSRDRLEMIALSDRPGEFKFSPEGKERERLVHRTPTIVLTRGGREIGRIVQNSVGTLEEDMLAIAKGEPYAPRFGAEARLHEIVSSGGMDALEGRTSELVEELGALGDPGSLWHYAQYDLLLNDRPREAAAVLDVALEMDPESARSHLLLAKARRELGELDGALASVRRALELDGANEDARALESELAERAP